MMNATSIREVNTANLMISNAKVRKAATYLAQRVVSTAKVAAIKSNVVRHEYKCRNRAAGSDKVLKAVRAMLKAEGYTVSIKRGLLNTYITIAW